MKDPSNISYCSRMPWTFPKRIRRNIQRDTFSAQDGVPQALGTGDEFCSFALPQQVTPQSLRCGQINPSVYSGVTPAELV